MIGEYSTIVQTESNAKTVYTTNDHLGSPRINTDGTGQVISRHDYHPFGEEIARTGYGSDTIRKQFTGYERDGETGLDFAQARYFSSGLGRFSSPDPSLASGRQALPASWNKYAYTLNNPLKYTDPWGLYEFDPSLDDTQRENFREQLKELEKRLKAIKKAYGKNSEEYREVQNSLNAYGCEAGSKGCSEKVGSSQVIVRVGPMPAGASAYAQRNSTDTKNYCHPRRKRAVKWLRYTWRYCS